MKKGFLMVLVAFVSLLLCVVPIKVNPYGGDLVLTFGDKPETGYYVNNNYNNVFIDSGTSSIKKFYFGEISNKGNLNTAGSFSYHGKNWVFDETLRGPFGECPLLEYLEVKDKDSKDYTMLSSKNSEYCRKYDCNSVQLKDSNINLGESTYRRTCKYKNPFGGDDITFEFLDGGTHIAMPSTSYYYQGYNKNTVTANNMYISPTNSSIKDFYIGGMSSYNNISIYESPGSFSYGGANWIFASSMTGKVWTSGGSLDPTKPSTNVSSKCTDYLGHASNNGTIAHFLDNIWDIIKVGSILLVIVFAMIDLAKTLSNDKEKIPVVLKRTVMRLIFLIVLLILPTLVEALGNLAGVDGILCGIK